MIIKRIPTFLSIIFSPVPDEWTRNAINYISSHLNEAFVPSLL